MAGVYLVPDISHLEESIQLIQKHQGYFEYNDFFTGTVLDDKKKQIEIIDEYARVRTDFSKDTMHGAFLDVTVHSSDEKIRQVSELRVRQSMDIAKEMGLRGVVLHTNRLQGFRVEQYLKNWLETNEIFLRKICEEYPMQQVFMENMFDEAPDILAELAKRMIDVPNFGVCLDYAHAAISRTELDIWMQELAPYIKHMHINDNDLQNDLHDAVGSGQIDWKNFAEEMQRYHIEASVLVEVSGEEKQKKSLEYMKMHRIYPFV